MIDNAAVKDFARLSRASIAKEKRDESRCVLVDAAYRHPYIVTCTLLIAARAAALIDASLVVMTGPGITPDVEEIVRSFEPRRVVTIRHLGMRGARNRLGQILGTIARVRSGDDLVALTWDGRDVGPHLYDTLLMRFGLASIQALTPVLRAHLFLELCILDGFRRLVEDIRPQLAVLPDNVYRAGGFFEVLAGNRIPMLAGIDVNGLAVHHYPRNGSFTAHCRTPDPALVNLVRQTPELMERAEAYLRSRTSGREVQHDARRAFHEDAVFLDRKSLCEIMHFGGTKPLVLVAAHVFSDAPHACRGLIFRDYQVWLRETCRLLKANPDVDFLVKEHPSAELYGELGLTARLLGDWGASAHYLPVRVNTRSLFESVDAVITCGGTAGSEFPCFGVPVLLAAGAPYDQLGCVRRAHTLEEYAREIGRLHLYEKLGGPDMQTAKAALFVMQVVSKIPKGSVGMGAEPFVKGVTLDFDEFLREAARDLERGVSSRRLAGALRELLAGPYENLIDASLLENGPAFVGQTSMGAGGVS